MWKFNCNTLSLVNCATASNGDDEFCYCNTCSENEGDCDSRDECLDGLACGSKNCPVSLGFDSEIDCCSIITQIMSPNYPNSYPSNAYETWLLTAPNGSIINLQFVLNERRSIPLIEQQRLKHLPDLVVGPVFA